MRSEDLVSSFGEIARAKDIDRETLQIIVEDVIRAMIDKRYGSDEAFEIIFNPNQGDIQILHIQEVVPDYELVDPVTEMEVSKAQEMDEGVEVGDEVAGELNINDFGRRAVLTARQTFRQRIRDIEKEKIYEEYSELVGEIIVGEIYQVRRHETLLMHEGVEVSLPRNEQIPSDHYRKGNMLRTVVKEVRRDAGSDPQVVVSRTSPVFMERLFEIEVPEVYDGIVEIKEIARIPGDRAKVAVTSHDERVDPVGACVGVKGVRIHAVVRELANENIDVMEWSENPNVMVKRALSPANPTSVSLNDDADPPRARVEVPSDEVSQAIGRRGVNIKLASQLTGYEIDVFREIPADEEDIDIEEFGDELTEETIEKLKHIGCDTGKAVLELTADALARRADLDRDVAGRVRDIIEAEFEKGPGVIESIERGRFTVAGVEGEESVEESGSVEDVDAAPDVKKTGAETTGAEPPETESPEAESPEAESPEVESTEAESTQSTDIEQTESEAVAEADVEADADADAETDAEADIEAAADSGDVETSAGVSASQEGEGEVESSGDEVAEADASSEPDASPSHETDSIEATESVPTSEDQDTTDTTTAGAEPSGEAPGTDEPGEASAGDEAEEDQPVASDATDDSVADAVSGEPEVKE